MDELDALVGEWELAITTGDGETFSGGRARFEWIADGAFLKQRGEAAFSDDVPQVWRDNAPRTIDAVIGLDDHSGTYSFLYYDSRGVHRVYEMSLDDREWRIWGQAGPEFFQRFSGTLADDGSRIDARWERSTDGEDWQLDFELRYSRAT
jgi:hypothetical protein